VPEFHGFDGYKRIKSKNITIICFLFRPTFVLQDEKLIKYRYRSSCALIKGKDGLPIVAIIGGDEKGMELWNPQTREVELLWNEIPPEVGGSYGLSLAEILPINDGTELILYGGSLWRSYKDEIWKYTVETNSWTKYWNYFI